MRKLRQTRALVAVLGLVVAPLGTLAVTSATVGAGTSCAASNTTVTSSGDTGAGTLRTAITNANGNSGAQSICIDTTLVTAPIVLGSDLPVYTGTATHNQPLTIHGNGATVNGNGHVAIGSTSSGLLTIDGLTVTGANNGGSGGGVVAFGAVTVMNSTITNNTTGVFGGGISSVLSGAVTVTNSTISNNKANTGGGGGGGGGIETAGPVTVTNSTITGNQGTNSGGIAANGGVTVTNSTISNNTATGAFSDAGGIGSAGGNGNLTLVYSTVVQNSASNAGANVFALAKLTSFASVVAQPQGGATNCSVGSTMSNGFNFTDDASAAVSCMFNAMTDHVGASNNPNLSSLANNGGPTQTMLPQSGSPLVDGVAAGSCQADGAAGITTDQRGLPRPDTSSPACDIGAVEVQPPSPTAPTAVIVTPRFTG